MASTAANAELVTHYNEVFPSKIDLTGATGKLDFDLATGEAPFDQAILCVGIDARGRASEGIESGLVYAADAKRLVGALRCP